MRERPETWHYGLVARWWAEFNDDFRPHEIPYFQRFVEAGQPALDVGCGTGRLLIPFLRAGVDVDGCDVSAAMIAACREKAVREGLEPTLYVQPMHELDLPRAYATIYVCGSFGLGSNRARDAEALRRFADHLQPGGTLLIDIEAPYADAEQWGYWLKERRGALPEAAQPPRGRRSGSDGAEYALRSRVLELDPLNQHVTLEIQAERWHEGVHDVERHTIDIGLYFRNEVLLMLQRAGFGDVVVHGEHTEREATSADEFMVFVARR